jgi:hypothetical protein
MQTSHVNRVVAGVKARGAVELGHRKRRKAAFGAAGRCFEPRAYGLCVRTANDVRDSALLDVDDGHELAPGRVGRFRGARPK